MTDNGINSPLMPAGARRRADPVLEALLSQYTICLMLISLPRALHCGGLGWGTMGIEPEQQPRASLDRRGLVLALLALTAGSLVYLFARAPTTYVAWPLHDLALPRIGTGLLLGCLPSFCHAFAFAWLGAALLRPWPLAARNFVIGWTLFEAAVELVQIKPLARGIDAALVQLSPNWADAIGGYLMRSTFDVADLTALAAGGAAAWWMHVNSTVGRTA